MEIFITIDDFCQEFTKGYGNKIHLRSVIPFWNRVDKREHTELYNMFNTLLKEEGFDLLKTELPESKRFSRELSTERKFAFRSTMFPYQTYRALRQKNAC